MEMERRAFLKGAAITGLAASMMGIAGCANGQSNSNVSSGNDNTQGNTQTSTDTTDNPGITAGFDANSIDVKETCNCDIVVCGTGIGGMAAIVQAAENGAKVIAVEAAAKPGGNGNGIGGMFAHGSSLQKEKGIEFDFATLIATEMASTQYRVNGQLWKNLYNESGENFDWLVENGVKFSGKVDDYGTGGIQSMHYFDGRGGKGYIDPMVKKAEDLGVEFYYSTKAEHPVLENGIVKGVFAQKSNGDWVRVNAKSVILATGGFGANNDMVARIGYDPENIWYWGVPENDGGGWRIAMEAGAKDFSWNSADNAHAYIRAMPHDGPDTMPNCGLSMCGYLVWVNQDCERFVREDCGARNFCQQNPPRWNQEKWYFVFDTETYKLACQMYGVDPDEGMKIMDESLKTNEGECLFSADTIEELAGFYDLDSEALVNTINTYNEYCKTGVDEDWCKDTMFLKAIENPPYYITKPETLFLMSIGAIYTDENGQAVDDEQKPIPNLYAVGVDGCMLYRNVYTIDVPASCCGNSVCMGRRAANKACEDL